jgi:preprotein translocase subunit SecB
LSSKGKKTGKILFSIAAFAIGYNNPAMFGISSSAGYSFAAGMYGMSLASTIWSVAAGTQNTNSSDYSNDDYARFSTTTNEINNDGVIPVIYGTRKWGGRKPSLFFTFRNGVINTKTTNKHLIGMKNEQNILKITYDLYGVESNKFTYIVYDNKDCRDAVTFDIDKENSPQIVFDSKKQLDGSDILYNGLSFDIKINGKAYQRSCFELYTENDGTFSYRKPKDTASIIMVMNSSKLIFTFPCSLIEQITNRVNINNLNLPYDFYNNESLFFDKLESYTGTKKDGKKLFFINPDILQAALRQYIAYECNNKDMIWFYFNINPYETNIEFKEA